MRSVRVGTIWQIECYRRWNRSTIVEVFTTLGVKSFTCNNQVYSFSATHRFRVIRWPSLADGLSLKKPGVATTKHRNYITTNWWSNRSLIKNKLLCPEVILVVILHATLFEPINFQQYLSDYQSPIWLAPDKKIRKTVNYVTEISRVRVLMILFVVRQILWFWDDQCSWIEFGWNKIGFLPNWHFISISTYQINSFQPLLRRCEAQVRSRSIECHGQDWSKMGTPRSVQIYLGK